MYLYIYSDYWPEFNVTVDAQPLKVVDGFVIHKLAGDVLPISLEVRGMKIGETSSLGIGPEGKIYLYDEKNDRLSVAMGPCRIIKSFNE